MKTQLIAIAFADSTIGIMAFILDDGRDGGVRQEATVESINREIARSKFQPRQVPVRGWRFIQGGECPEDRSYRDAWRDRGDKIDHDIEHARDIHRDKLRSARAPLLSGLDVEYQRADESNDQTKKRDVARRKQALRDAPADPRIEAAQTIEELKAIDLPE